MSVVAISKKVGVLAVYTIIPLGLFSLVDLLQSPDADALKRMGFCLLFGACAAYTSGFRLRSRNQ